MSLTQTQSIDQIAFLEGSWTAQRGTGAVEEVWMPPKGGSMMGMGRTTREGRTTFAEFWQVTEVEGKLKMQLQMKLGGPVIDWTAEVSPNRVLFTSMNDPNKGTLEYRRTGDKLKATVRGEREGQPYTIEFDFERTKGG